MRHTRSLGSILIALGLVGCTTVRPPSVAHPDKSFSDQDTDKYECWTAARTLTGHDPEGASPGGKLLGVALIVGSSGYLAARHPGTTALLAPLVAATLRPGAEPPDAAAARAFREAYVDCLTRRGYTLRQPT